MKYTQSRILDFFCLSLIALVVYRFSLLRHINFRISDSIICIRLRYPLASRSRASVLEFPINKILSCKVERGIISSFLMLKIDTQRGVKNRYYKLGFLDKAQLDKIQIILNFLTKYDET